MSSIPYFSITKHSFEKNAGYKNTVHALAELIDNGFEADASQIAVVLMTNRDKRLQKIGIIDNGNGMSPKKLQAAMCEKSGEHLDRQYSTGASTRKKLGKYGVGLPKASISQCNKFTVWSWTSSGFKNAYCNLVDIEDEAWIDDGANIKESWKDAPNSKWLEVVKLEKSAHGTFVLWENLDGVTWWRTHWGDRSGLIPNLKFHVGRIYRKMLAGKNPDLKITVFVINEQFKVEEEISIEPNDPLYITPKCDIPRKKLNNGELWPPDDPLFDDITGTENHHPIPITLSDGTSTKVNVTFRRSVAKKNTQATLDGVKAGRLPHGEHAGRNTGLSILREGREVDLSLALTSPNKPQERWFGVEFDIPHELDSVLGMTNNKQGYTRLDQVLRQNPEEFLEGDESGTDGWDKCLRRLRNEDPQLAVCLELAWLMQRVWSETRDESEKGRVAEVNTKKTGETASGEDESSPEGKAEQTASDADKGKKGQPTKEPTETEKEARKKALIDELRESGVPQREAEETAERMVKKGLSYAILKKSGLGSPFFNVRPIVDAKVIELNSDHAVYPLLLSSIQETVDMKPEDLAQRLKDTKMTILLMLEAWAKVESQTQLREEKKRFQNMREDWGRCLEDFIAQLETEKKS